MSVKVMAWVWDHSKSRGNDRLVLLAIADNAGHDGGDAYPGRAELGRKTGLSPKTVQRSIKALVDLGELSVVSTGTGTRSTRYRVKMRKLESVTEARRGSHSDQGGQFDQGGHSDRGVKLTPVSNSPEGGSADTPGGVQDDHQTVLNHPGTKEQPSASLRGIDAKFDEFWQVYPRKASKAAAKVKFAAALKRNVPFETIVEGARRYRDDPNRVDEFTKHPTTWLNQGCWDDAPLPRRSDKGARGRQESNADVVRDLMRDGQS